MNILFVFIDGLGVGRDDPGSNPLARHSPPHLNRLMSSDGFESERFLYRSIDANLDIEGLPQSGTGQATLFTGVNCARLAGRHFGPYPHSTSHETIATKNVFLRVTQLTGDRESAAFANAYPPPFFKRSRRRDRWTVTTRCCIDAGIKIRDLDDLAAGRAVAADVTGVGLVNAGFAVTPVTEHKAAEALVDLATRHRLTIFEYFLTDKAGHSQSMTMAGTVLATIDIFLKSVTERIDRLPITLIMTSDHGNIEDLSTKTHTRNPVPFAALGPAAQKFAGVRSLTDVAPAVLTAIAGDPS